MTNWTRNITIQSSEGYFREDVSHGFGNPPEEQDWYSKERGVAEGTLRVIFGREYVAINIEEGWFVNKIHWRLKKVWLP